ncbi:MAG: phosphoribosylformylglycinamidine cyclo-ligase [Chloroflexi bacterium]|nr:phosphoribosylformylglycinamidine cyclo-ligase [Chloroflexota bacterium]
MAEEQRDLADAYARAGVDAAAEESGLAGLLRWLRPTLRPAGLGSSRVPFGYFATVLDLGDGRGLALTTDGVGSKVLVAQMVDRYDTVGIDCVAMNVNDLLCVGAEPLAMVDYIAVQQMHPRLLDELGRGLAEGARQAGISIPGGEIAQLREVVRGVRDGWAFDLAGAAVGLVRLDDIVIGQAVEPGDALLGLASSGIHSNGLTLARRALFQQGGLSPGAVVTELGRSVGEELLEPTRIYVAAVRALRAAGVAIRALCHLTGDGWLNLARVAAPVGFAVDWLPEPPPIFQAIQRLGSIADAEMYQVFNMGIGFAVVVPPDEADRAAAILQSAGYPAWLLGRAVGDPERRVQLAPLGLIGEGHAVRPA